MLSIKSELTKIFKSWQAPIGFGLVTILSIIILYGFSKDITSLSPLQGSIMSLVNITKTGAISIITITIASLLFTHEFKYKTLKYIIIRPVSILNLFISKTIAIVIYTTTLLLFALLLNIILSTLFFEPAPMITNGIILSQGITRTILMYGGVLINCSFIFSLAILYSVTLKNQISAIISAFGSIFILMAASTYLPILNLITPARTYQLGPLLFQSTINYQNILTGLLISFIYGLIFLTISYFIIKNQEVSN